ncbi:MAG: hypothetical protein NT125_06595 [Candidatus Bipolaricaulota bacterium]|nr:hypothetical protein [Candidatus Bipolaricaulota bacterium]
MGNKRARGDRGDRGVLDWLLDPENPSVRALTLRGLLGRPPDDPEVVAACAAISLWKPVERIFARQAEPGHWGDPESPYLPKYKATYWTVMLLAELGLTAAEERAKRAAESLFRFQSPDGGFAECGEVGAQRECAEVAARRRAKGKEPPDEEAFVADYLHQATLSCLTGNVLAALLRIGFAEDPRLARAVGWLLEIQNEDGGWLCPYWKAHVRDRHSCFFGTIAPLEALSELPRDRRSPAIEMAADRAAEFLLAHRLYKADHHGFRVIHPGWLTLSFPFSYNYTVLRGLSVLSRLEIRDERMEDVRGVLREKRTQDGKWLLEGTPAGRMQTSLEKKGVPSKAITLACLRALGERET